MRLTEVYKAVLIDALIQIWEMFDPQDVAELQLPSPPASVANEL